MCVRASTLVTMLLASAAVGQETAGTADLTPVGRGAYVSIAGAMDLSVRRQSLRIAQRQPDPEQADRLPRPVIPGEVLELPDPGLVLSAEVA